MSLPAARAIECTELSKCLAVLAGVACGSRSVTVLVPVRAKKKERKQTTQVRASPVPKAKILLLVARDSRDGKARATPSSFAV